MNLIEEDSDGRTLWVTGAGSGMGRAVARSAAARGYKVALSGRRKEALEETARLIGQEGGASKILTMDSAVPSQVLQAKEEINREWGLISHVVLSAGLNHPRRYWRDQSMSDFNEIVTTNLTGAAYVTDAVLPDMRSAGGGVVLFVSSFSGWQYSPDAGVAYSSSKTALASLAQSLNGQENRNGIRSCHLCPGDVDTDFLSMRPQVPGSKARESMLGPADIAAAVQFVLDSPSHVCINELVITPVKKQ